MTSPVRKQSRFGAVRGLQSQSAWHSDVSPVHGVPQVPCDERSDGCVLCCLFYVAPVCGVLLPELGKLVMRLIALALELPADTFEYNRAGESFWVGGPPQAPVNPCLYPCRLRTLQCPVRVGNALLFAFEPPAGSHVFYPVLGSGGYVCVAAGPAGDRIPPAPWHCLKSGLPQLVSLYL